MIVDVHLYSQSAPVHIEHVRNAYTKEALYCVLQQGGIAYKFPLVHIFRITETPSTP